MIAFWRAFRDYKPGDPVDVPEMIAHAKKMSRLGFAVYGSSMEALIANGDKAGMESLMGAIDPDDFLDGIGISTYAAALEMLDRKDELELVRESVDDVIRKEMMSAWFDESYHSAQRALELAAIFKRSELLTPAWRKDMANLTADPMVKACIEARLARLDGDWQGMLAALAPVKDQVKVEETNWDYLSAVAQIGLGKPDLARSHLERVVKIGILEGSSFSQSILLLKSLDQAAK
jgi:hypothetical protein